jgi:hypothetical protein
VEWPRGEATACKAVYTGSNPVSTSQHDCSTESTTRTTVRSAPQFGPHHQRAIGAVWLARFPDTEEVTGSSPVSPTM